MKLVLELDQPVVHPQLDLDRNPRSYQQQNTGLVGESTEKIGLLLLMK